MENEITFEEIKTLFKEVATSQKETEARFKDIEAGFKETEARFKEIQAEFKETDAKVRAMAAQVNETSAIVREVSKQLGGIGNSNGYFAEQFFAHSLREKKTMGGVQFDEVEVNLKHKRKGIIDEFDIVMYNGDSIAIVEVKYVAAVGDLKNLIEKKVANFKYLYPEYAGYKIYLGLAGLSFENDLVKKQGTEAGVAILEAKGDHAEITADNMKAF
jgi:hypothetical protein